MNERDLSAYRVLKPYRTPSGWLILPVHYTHDPEKAAPEWAIEEMRRYMSAGFSEADWSREMELDFGQQLGAACYVNFRAPIHLVDSLEVNPHRPLNVCMDFNVSPGAWVITQFVQGFEDVLDEIVLDPANPELMAREFRTRYPAHPAEIHVYGDASGNSRGQTARSSYDLVRIAFAGYPSPVVFFVPEKNPHVKDRVNAVNRVLKGAEGAPKCRIDRRCVHLIADLQEVVWRPDGKEIHKVYDSKNPYSKRTHTSDAWGYRVAREFPVVAEVIKSAGGKRAPRPMPKNWLGRV